MPVSPGPRKPGCGTKRRSSHRLQAGSPARPEPYLGARGVAQCGRRSLPDGRGSWTLMKPHEHYNARYVWLLAAVAALGGLLFGYDWVVIGGAKPFYEKYFQLSSARQIGWANSCALLGCLLGSLVAGAAADRFGRKIDRKSTRLNSSHRCISYAVFCLKK